MMVYSSRMYGDQVKKVPPEHRADLRLAMTALLKSTPNSMNKRIHSSFRRCIILFVSRDSLKPRNKAKKWRLSSQVTIPSSKTEHLYEYSTDTPF